MATRDYKGPVVFTGENPGLTLYAPGGDRIVAAASYWHCTYSAHGEGDALEIWVADADGQPGWRAIYADNAALGRFVAATFNEHFADYRGQGFATLEPTPARFSQESDSRAYHRVACHGADRRIVLEWRDVIDRRQIIGSGMALGGRSFELATVICPCAAGTIAIDDRPLAGAPRVGERDGHPQSSAFLAFAESWVENG